MDKKRTKRMTNAVTMMGYCLLLTLLVSCSKDEEGPRIDSVWYNMVEAPIEQTEFAYPGQTICLHGEHLGDLKRVIVNGTDINLNTLFVYESDTNITFQLPSDVNTEGDNIRVVTRWGMGDYHFIIRPTSEKPAITAFSATTLIAGRTLSITGTHLDGAQEVWLPLAFGGRTKCEIDALRENDETNVHAIIPDDVTFAKGRCEIVLEKTDTVRNITFTEKVYSGEINFRN